MPTASRTPQQQMSLTPFVLVLTAVAAVVAIWFRLPAAVVVAIGITIAAWAYVAPQLPRGETMLPPKGQASQRRWRELRWRVLVPNADWLLRPTSELDDFRTRAGRLVPVPGLSDALGVLAWAVMPTRFISVVSLALAAAAVTLPVDGRFGSFILPPEFVWVNALAAFLSVTVVDNVVRRTITQYDPSPGVSIGAMLEGLCERDGGAWRALVGFVLLGIAAAVAVMLVTIGLRVEWLIVPWPVFCIGLGAAVAAGSLHGVFRERGLESWRDTVAARAAWVTRWEGLKNPDVHMVSHEKVGPATVDTFDAPATLGSSGAINMYPKVLPFLGAGVQAAMLTVPDTDSQGQPIPGSAHPARFRVVTWPSDAEVDVTSAATPLEVVKLRIETAVFLAATEGRYPTPALLDAAPMHAADEGAAVWATQWTSPVPMAGMVQNVLQAEGFSEGAEFYFGAFDDAELKDKTLLERREKVQTVARWNQRWADLLKMGDKPPHLQYEHHRTARFDPQTTIHFQPFLVSQGLNPTSYFQQYIAQGLSTTLAAAPFVTVTGLTGQFVPAGLPGERHPQGFAVIWSDKAVPASPAQVTPLATRDAQKWVLAGQVNAAFDAVKLARPEVVEAQCLTTRQSGGHVWKLSLRLFDGVTAADVKAKVEKLRQVMGGVPWTRVTEWEYGCLLYAGAPPRQDGVKFASPQGLATCNKLDWEQAFLESGLTSPMDGASPKMLSSEPTESNEKITRFEFTMPRGLNIGKVRESVSKLRAATVNEYVDIRDGSTPDKFVILAAELNPMPFPAYVDWDKAADTEGKKLTRIPFAAAIDGTDIVFDWTVDPHLNILGASGGGKSILIQVIMATAILHGCDVFLVDPIKGGQDFDFATPWLRANIAQADFVGAGEVLSQILVEADHRKRLNVEYNVGNYKDLPDNVRPRHMFVFIDEFQSLIKSRIPIGREPESPDPDTVAAWDEARMTNAGISKITNAVGKLAREARSVGITLVLAGQAMKADELKRAGLDGLKVNFSRAAVGKMTFGELSSAFKDPQTLPDLGSVVPPGRGLFESTSAAGVAMQVFWEPGSQPKMREEILERLEPIPDDRRYDVESMKTRVMALQPKQFGEIIDDGPDDDTVVEVDLGDLGISDLSLSFDMGLSFGESATEEDEPAETQVAEAPIVSTVDVVLEVPEADATVADEHGAVALFDDDFFATEVTTPEEPFEPAIEVVPAPATAPELVPVPVTPELVEPPVGGPVHETDESAEPEPLISEALPEPLFVAERTRYEGAVRVTDTPEAGALVFGIDLPLPAAAPETGWVKAEAVLNLLRDNPDITSVTWSTADLLDEDDIGIPHIALVEEMLGRAGVVFVPEQTTPRPSVADERRAVPDVPTVEPPAPAPEPVSSARSADDDDDWFSAPKPKSGITAPDIEF